MRSRTGQIKTPKIIKEYFLIFTPLGLACPKTNKNVNYAFVMKKK
jgi:hypothetical protein